jgi:hypothetical protein
MVPTRRALITVWLAAVVAMGAVLVVSRATQSPGDDVDPARQRPGILDLGPLPVAAPTLSNGVPAPGDPTVVFFAGSQAADLCAELPGADLDDVTVVVVAADAGACGPGVVVPETSGRKAAEAFGLPSRRDGGVPVGYAIVDAKGQIRYRTLDPSVAGLLDEVATMVDAL